jgi:GTP-binding protein
MDNLSKVVIVGRVNVGKSTLFNRLSTEVKSIIFDYPGVTRDIIKDVVTWCGKPFELIDTGGVSFKKKQDSIEEEVRLRALQAVKDASIIIFVCDAKVGVIQDDLEILNLLRKLGKKIFLVANKTDSPLAEENRYQFEKLGFKDTFYISANHGKGIAELLEAIAENVTVPEKIHEEFENKQEWQDKEFQDAQEDKTCKVVLLGKPNVGKSSLLNALMQEDRAIVSPVPGTTREPIKEKIKFSKGDIQITDTAGVRRKRTVDEDLEKLMVKTSFKALKDANIVLLMVDSSEKALCDQELKLLFYAFENHKAVILLFNKQDLVDRDIREQLDFSLEPYSYFMKKIEIMNISCKSGRNIDKILDLIDKVWVRHSQRFSNDELTMLFKDALVNKPLHHKTMALIVRAVKQVANSPITLLIIANVPEWFGHSQLTFFENLLRAKYDLKSVPIKFVVRRRD